MSKSTLTSGDNQQWAQAAEKARAAAASVGEMAGHAASAIAGIASHAADEIAANAGARIQALGDRINSNAPHEGVLRSASQSVARTVNDAGEYLEGAKLSGVTEDVAQLIRRNPIPSVLIAIGVGWFLARKLRS